MRFSNQQTFDKIVRHLRKQGGKAETYNGCQYLTDDGRKCAAGCLITKREYNPAFEGMSVCRLSMTCINPIGKLIRKKGHNLRLVRAMQSVHDDFTTNNWEREFQKVASRFKIEYVPPKTRKTLS